MALRQKKRLNAGRETRPLLLNWRFFPKTAAHGLVPLHLSRLNQAICEGFVFDGQVVGAVRGSMQDFERFQIFLAISDDHDALSRVHDLSVYGKPVHGTGFSFAEHPLNGIQLFKRQKAVQMIKLTDAVLVINGVRKGLGVVSDKRYAG